VSAGVLRDTLDGNAHPLRLNATNLSFR